jgi:hypothetical protein
MTAFKPKEHAYQKFQLRAIALSRFQVSQPEVSGVSIKVSVFQRTEVRSQKDRYKKLKKEYFYLTPVICLLSSAY